MKSKLEEAILGTGSARSDLMMRRRNISHFYQRKDPNITCFTSDKFHSRFVLFHACQFVLFVPLITSINLFISNCSSGPQGGNSL